MATHARRNGIAASTCLVMGGVFLVVAAWGFIDGERVLIFHVNAAHNVVHLLSGLGALACGLLGERAAKGFAFAFGAVYAGVAILGFSGVGAVVNLLRLNAPDHWLHLGIALTFLTAGLLSRAPAWGSPPDARAQTT